MDPGPDEILQALQAMEPQLSESLLRLAGGLPLRSQSLHLGPGECRFSVDKGQCLLTAQLDFTDAAFRYHCTDSQKVKLTGYPDRPADFIVRKIADSARSRLDNMVREIFNGIPMGLEHGSVVKNGRAVIRISRNPEALWDGMALDRIIADVAARSQEALAEGGQTLFWNGLRESQREGWASSFPLRVTGCRVRASADRAFRLTVSCEADLCYERTWTEKAAETGEPLARRTLPEDLRELQNLIVGEFQTLSRRAFRQFRNGVPPYQADLRGAPQELRELLLEGRTTLGKITIRSPHFDALPEERRKGKNFFPALDAHGNFQVFTLPLSQGRHSGSAGRLGTESLPPHTIARMWRLASAFAAEYQVADFGETRKSPVRLEVSEGVIRSIRVRSCDLPVREPEGRIVEEDIRLWARQLTEKVLRFLQCRDDDPAAQTLILQEQNPAVLAIIRYIYRVRRSTRTEMRSSMGEELPTTRASLERYLHQAASVRVPVSGRTQLVVRRVSVDGRYQHYDSYRPNPNVSPEVVAAAVPAPFTVEDLPYLTPRGRDQWLLDLAAGEGREKSALRALDQVPMSVAADFMKSGEGQSFLRRLTGEDVETALRLLNTLPGCKRLGKITGQGDAPAEGPELPGCLNRKPAIAKVRVRDYLSAFTLDHLIRRAEQLDRAFVLHVGPTNSGKTYEALKALRQADSGVYLGPLRLLALEVADTLNGEGYPCTLLTGEEWTPVPGARLTASTVEMADCGTWYDVAVIDECQMLQDPERGCHWLKAITSLAAREIHLCLAPEALTVLQDLLWRFTGKIRIVRHQRLTPLVWGGSFPGLGSVRPGDALIAFSRKMVLAIAAQLEDNGVRASVIYGALPPQSRREEVRRFQTGETRVVVATDAIGMGISLPIRRVIFCRTSKYDGTLVRDLQIQEIQQIAGRAGRYGICDKGSVLSMSSPDMVRNALNAVVPDIREVILPFPEEALETPYKLGTMIRAWNSLDPEEGLSRADMSNALALLRILESRLAKESMPDRRTLYSLITCPVDRDSEALTEYWYRCCLCLLEGRPVPDPIFPEDTLEECELKYKALDIQHQMGRRGGVELDNMPAKLALSEKINGFLRSSKNKFLRRCSACGRRLSATSPYGMCESCHAAIRGWRDWDGIEDEDEEDDF